jgi:hypothetical protein
MATGRSSSWSTKNVFDAKFENGTGVLPNGLLALTARQQLQLNTALVCIFKL